MTRPRALRRAGSHLVVAPGQVPPLGNLTPWLWTNPFWAPSLAALRVGGPRAGARVALLARRSNCLTPLTSVSPPRAQFPGDGPSPLTPDSWASPTARGAHAPVTRILCGGPSRTTDRKFGFEATHRSRSVWELGGGAGWPQLRSKRAAANRRAGAPPAARSAPGVMPNLSLQRCKRIWWTNRVPQTRKARPRTDPGSFGPQGSPQPVLRARPDAPNELKDQLKRRHDGTGALGGRAGHDRGDVGVVVLQAAGGDAQGEAGCAMKAKESPGQRSAGSPHPPGGGLDQLLPAARSPSGVR